MNGDIGKKTDIKRCGKIKLISPLNGEEIELTNRGVLDFIDAYENGTSAEYPFGKDRYAPKKLRLKWDGEGLGWNVFIAYSPDFAEKTAFYTENNFLETDVHFIKREVYWKVVSADGSSESEVFKFSLKRLPETVFIEGAVNVRDIGGYLGENGKIIKRGLVYRGAYADGITENGKVFAEKILKIKTDLDLRNEGEGSADSEFSPLGFGVKHILKCGCMYTGNEWGGIEHKGKEGIDIPEGARKLVEELLVFEDSANFPVYCHCVLGRDRTGTLIAVLLALCGVDERDIAFDYQLSFFEKNGESDGAEIKKIIGFFSETVEYLKTFKGETLQEKTAEFLKASGMNGSQIAKIKENLLGCE